MYYDLKNNKYIKKEKTNLGLLFLYNTIIGRIFLKVLTSTFISNLYAKYMNSSLSIHKINKFIKKNNIDMNEYVAKKYTSFNDFFTRIIKKDKRKIENGLIAICDSKLSVYEIGKNISFKIKNSIYTINELVQDDIKEDYKYALVFRLCVDDYHHYIYLDDGKLVKNKKIKGILHTVQPIAFKKHKVFLENSREVTYIDTKKYGKVCYVEVGAMMIGKITNLKKTKFKKGEEKGYFEFGGSTVVVLLNDKAKINKKLIENTKKDIETIVKLGQSLE